VSSLSEKSANALDWLTSRRSRIPAQVVRHHVLEDQQREADHQELPTVDGFRRGYLDLRPTARRAEEVGLDSLWVGDHLVANAPIVRAWSQWPRPRR
jgi:hypothetical protein